MKTHPGIGCRSFTFCIIGTPEPCERTDRTTGGWTNQDRMETSGRPQMILGLSHRSALVRPNQIKMTRQELLFKFVFADSRDVGMLMAQLANVYNIAESQHLSGRHLIWPTSHCLSAIYTLLFRSPFTRV